MDKFNKLITLNTADYKNKMMQCIIQYELYNIYEKCTSQRKV